MTKKQKVYQILSKATNRAKYSSPNKWLYEYVDEIMKVFKEKS